jgi:hypothetical protein
MQFKSREYAQQYLSMYSFAAGFSIVVVSVYRTTSKKMNNKIIRATIKCSKHGHNASTPKKYLHRRSQQINIKRADLGKPYITTEHLFALTSDEHIQVKLNIATNTQTHISSSSSSNEARTE